jgi:hypothetical protein
MSNAATKKPRLLYIDNLRILLTVLVILHHTAIMYGGPGDFPYNERGDMSDISTIVMTLFLAINQSFFMGFFFMISSYFIPGSIDRKGSGAFLIDRLKRLGIPLVLFMLLIFPLTIYPVARLSGFGGTVGRFLSDYYADLDNFTFGPLWFVAMLLIFALAYVLWRGLVNQSGAPAQSDGKAPSNAAIAAFALALGLATFIVRIWIPVGEGVPLLNLQPAHVVQYIGLFTLGILAYRRNWFSGLSDAQGKFWLRIILLLIAVFPLLFVFGGALEGDFDSAFGGVHWQSFAYSIWEQFMCLAVVVTLLVLFRNRFNKQGTLTRGMSGAAYATYIFHATTIILLAVALRGIKLDLALKYVLVAPVAVALSFLVGYVAKKLPLAKNIL